MPRLAPSRLLWLLLAWVLPLGARAGQEDQDAALALLKQRNAVAMLRVQATLSVLKYEEHRQLRCATGKQRFDEFLTPALDAALTARSDGYERLLAAQLGLRMPKYELDDIRDRAGRSPYARNYNRALSESIKAAGPASVQLGAEIGQAAVIAALAKATEAGLVDPSAPCRE